MRGIAYQAPPCKSRLSRLPCFGGLDSHMKNGHKDLGGFEMKALQIRQGDVLLEAVEALPDGATAYPRELDGRVILAHGEATGHAHAFEENYVSEYRQGVDRFVVIQGGASAFLKHEEHTHHQVPPGIYKIRRQREYSHTEIRNVAD